MLCAYFILVSLALVQAGIQTKEVTTGPVTVDWNNKGDTLVLKHPKSRVAATKVTIDIKDSTLAAGEHIDCEINDIGDLGAVTALKTIPAGQTKAGKDFLVDLYQADGSTKCAVNAGTRSYKWKVNTKNDKHVIELDMKTTVIHHMESTDVMTCKIV